MSTKRSRDPGRPAYKATKERRELVSILTAAGFTESQISVALSCTEKTLRKHFTAELDAGAIKINARITEAIFRSAERGNSAAARYWRREIAGILPPRKPRSRPLGKKEQAAAAASDVAAGKSSWGDLLRVPEPPLSEHATEGVCSGV